MSKSPAPPLGPVVLDNRPVGARVVVLRLRAEPAGRGEPIQNLRRLLKSLVRQYGFVCTSAQVEDDEEPKCPL